MQSKKTIRVNLPLDSSLIDFATQVIKSDLAVNTYKFDSLVNKKLRSIKLDTLRPKSNKTRFAAVLLCGGKATRFGNTPKAVYSMNFPNGKTYSFLELNIRQILNYEKVNNTEIPVVIYDDLFTYPLIREELNKNNFFGKDPRSYFFIHQKFGKRYRPSSKLLNNNNLSFKESYAPLRKTTSLTTTNKEDSLVGAGHFIFNYLFESPDFQELQKKYQELETLVISNVDNLGQKYYKEAINSKKNLLIGCKRKKGEKMDLVFNQNNRVTVIPYYLTNKESKVGFTGTIYLNLESLFQAYRTAPSKLLDNKYYLVAKEPLIDGKVQPTVHFESPVSDIYRFCNFELLDLKRERCFHPFKSLEEINTKRLSLLLTNIEEYSYVLL